MRRRAHLEGSSSLELHERRMHMRHGSPVAVPMPCYGTAAVAIGSAIAIAILNWQQGDRLHVLLVAVVELD